MKTFNVAYIRGHLVDLKTGKRIFLKRNGEFTILGDDSQFEEKDDLLMKIQILDSKEKIKYLEKKYKDYELIKVANQGDVFVYRIGLSKSTNESKGKEFLFNAILLEDLYMKTKQRLIKDKNEEYKWSLCECMCETTECIEGEVQLIESIPGTSLSNLFSNMVAFYFPLQRSGACNAFKNFYFAEDEHHRISEIKSSQYWDFVKLKSIDDFRKPYLY